MAFHSLTSQINEKSFSKSRSWIRRKIQTKTIEIDGLTVLVNRDKMSRLTLKLLWNGTYEAPERVIASRKIKSDDRVLECGGGLGIVSMTIARIVGQDNLLVYEASPSSAQMIANNFELNGFDISIENAAIATDTSNTTFFQNNNLLSSSLTQRDGSHAINVKTHSINDILMKFRPTVLVMDIEGAEAEIFDNANLESLHSIIVEVHPHIVGDLAIAQMHMNLFKLGFIQDYNNSFQQVITFSKQEQVLADARASGL